MVLEKISFGTRANTIAYFFQECREFVLESVKKTYIVNKIVNLRHFFVEWKLKIVKNNQNRKTTVFTDFIEDVQQPEKTIFAH